MRRRKGGGEEEEDVGGGGGEVDSSRGNLNVSDGWCGGVGQGQG